MACAFAALLGLYAGRLVRAWVYGTIRASSSAVYPERSEQLVLESIRVDTALSALFWHCAVHSTVLEVDSFPTIHLHNMSSIPNESEKPLAFERQAPDNGPPCEAKGERDLDEAYKFLVNHAETPSNIDIKRITRKVDWRIVPIMFLIYLFNLLDKVSLNYAAVMGLPIDLKLKGNDFSNAATAFFGAYLAAELPTPFILNKIPAGKWLAVNVVLWGIATACTAAAKDYTSLLAARIFLGAFEAPVAPCLMLISSQWYTKSEQSPRFAFWYCGLGTAQIIGGILSFGFQQIEDGALEGWRVMFIVLGCLTVVLGGAAFWALPDSPMSATFLNDAEKTALLNHASENQTGVRGRNVKKSQFLEAAKDPQLWLLVLMTITVSATRKSFPLA